MALPRSRPTLAMLIAEADTKRALEYAVREHERQVALQEEAAIRRAMGERERGRTYRAPMRDAGMSAPRVVQGLAQPGALHQQNADAYRRGSNAPPLDPASQEMLDAQRDYNDEWLSRDEAGNIRLNRRPVSETLGVAPGSVAVDRAIASDEASRYVPKPAKTKPMKVRI